MGRPGNLPSFAHVRGDRVLQTARARAAAARGARGLCAHAPSARAEETGAGAAHLRVPAGAGARVARRGHGGVQAPHRGVHAAARLPEAIRAQRISDFPIRARRGALARSARAADRRHRRGLRPLHRRAPADERQLQQHPRGRRRRRPRDEHAVGVAGAARPGPRSARTAGTRDAGGVAARLPAARRRVYVSAGADVRWRRRHRLHPRGGACVAVARGRAVRPFGVREAGSGIVGPRRRVRRPGGMAEQRGGHLLRARYARRPRGARRAGARAGVGAAGTPCRTGAAAGPEGFLAADRGARAGQPTCGARKTPSPSGSRACGRSRPSDACR